MVEPPEKGKRATLNPNLATRLKPTFFRSGAAVGEAVIAGSVRIEIEAARGRMQ
jgi:hypothetical protein